MSVSWAQKHIFSDLKLELFIFRIYLLSPFEIIKHQRLANTWRVKMYMFVMVILYIVLRLSFYVQFQDSDAILRYFLIYGKFWMIVYSFDIMFSLVSFFGVVLNGVITSNSQIEFFQELHHFDVMLFDFVGIPIRRSRTRTANSCALIVGLLYFLGYFISGVIDDATFLAPYQVFAFHFTNFIDRTLNLLIALLYVNCTQLCRERLASVRKLLQNCSNFNTEQMDTVLQLYVRIRSQILLINRFMGFMIIKIAHDFTLGSSIVFFICSSLYSANANGDIFDITVWFLETVIGTLLMILAAECFMTEV